MLLDAERVENILPGINQARDADRKLIGTYHPDGYPQIAIEHGNIFEIVQIAEHTDFTELRHTGQQCELDEAVHRFQHAVEGF